MRFGLLGSLEVADDGGKLVDAGGTQPRRLLAVLLASSGRVVGVDALIDAMWGDEPPASAAGTLQSYVSRLRRRLGEGVPLLFEPPGYRLAVDTEQVDFRRFEAMVDDGQALLAAGCADEARSVLVDALALWRGPALAEFVDFDFAAGLAARLEERRRRAVEIRVAADLAVGRHAAIVGELSELVAELPFREELRCDLALALYRSGRQAEALRALADARQVLRDELGVVPGRPLQELEAAILAHDPALDLTVASAAAPESRHGKASTANQPGGDTAPPPHTGFIGRESELAELVAALAESRSATRVAILEGEPGIGKTRLAEEVSAEAACRGARVLWGRAFEGGAAPAYWPWLPPLREMIQSLPVDGALSPELHHLLAPSSSPEPGQAVTSAEPARFALFESIATVVGAFALVRPAVLVLEDVQWADVASLELLTALAGRLRDTPVLILCTVRELEVGRYDHVVDTLAALARLPGTRRLRLRGLSRRDTRELVALTTGTAPDGVLLERIFERAGGNPFFVTETARLLAAGAGPADVPSGVRDVVRRRLGQLPEPTGRLLHVAAVIGRDVEVGLLARASRSGLDHCLDDLEPAIGQRLLVPVAEQPGVYRFVHALVREVVVDDLPALRRARLHLDVADALDDGDDSAEILAEHLWQAAPIGVGQRAAAALERAARVAVLRLAYDAAKHLLERAVQLRRAAGSGEDDLAAELGAIGQLIAVEGARMGYAALNGSPLLVRGRQLAEALDRRPDLVHLLWAQWASFDLSCEFARAEPIATELLARTQALQHPVAPVVGHTAVGITRWHRGDITGAAEHMDTANELSRRTRLDTIDLALFDRDALRISAPFSVYLHVLTGEVEKPDPEFEAVIGLLPHDPFWELVVMNFAASAAVSIGETARAVRAARRGMAADPEGVSMFWSMALRAYLGAALCLEGAVDEGGSLLDEAWSRYSAVGLRTNSPTWHASRAHGLALARRLDEAERALAEAQGDLERYRDEFATSTVLLAEGVVRHVRRDDPAVVAGVLREAAAVATAQGARAMAARVHRDARCLGIELD